MSAIPEDLNTWGGSAWNGLLRDAFEFIGPVNGQRVLELGFRDGQIACAFASLGAHVTGLELYSGHVRAAQERAEILAVSEQTDFRVYDGNLATVPGEFDVVFTKSVLVTTDLPVMLTAIRGKLRPGGRFAFIENANGGPLRWLLRYCTRPPSLYRGVHYFTPKSVTLIRVHFRVELVKSTALPPVYLICGHSMA
jgi:SAM-dependent methyltransferase